MAFQHFPGPNFPYIIIAGGTVGYRLGYLKSIQIRFDRNYQMDVNPPSLINCLPININNGNTNHKSIRNIQPINYTNITTSILSNTSYELHSNQYINIVYSDINSNSYELSLNQYIPPVLSDINSNNYELNLNQYIPPILSTIIPSVIDSTIKPNLDTINSSIENDLTINFKDVPALPSVFLQEPLTSNTNAFNSEPSNLTIIHDSTDNAFNSISGGKNNTNIGNQSTIPELPPIPPITPNIYNIYSDTYFDIIDNTVSSITHGYIPPPIPPNTKPGFVGVNYSKSGIYPGGIGYARKDSKKI